MTDENTTMEQSAAEEAAALAIEDAIINTPVEVAPPTTHLPRTEKYLRNRPFLLIALTRRPAKASNVKTEVKGWGDNPGHWDTFEQPMLTDRVNATHLSNYAVIIDVINGKIVKNQFAETNADDEVVNHFLQKYRPQVTEAMDVWLSQLAQKVAKETAAERGISVTTA